jgi:lysophospholipid acyltransferase (LPLAT)-like uncharacterized protein
MLFKILCNLIYWFSRTLDATYRYKSYGMEHRKLAEAHRPGGAFVIASWHENVMPALLIHRNQKFSPLISQSKDGEFTAYSARKLGFRPVRGSSSRGGSEARQELIKVMDEGYSPAITVDGPRGPRRQVKAGVIDVARKCQAMIVPVCCMGKRNWVLSSWDKFRIPKPFTNIVLCYGEPIIVPADITEEQFTGFQNLLAERLNALQPVVDSYLYQGKKI